MAFCIIFPDTIRLMLPISKSKIFLEPARNSKKKLLNKNNFYREKDTVIATMNVLFDKAAYEKGRSLKPDVGNDIMNEDGSDMMDGKVVKKILMDSLVSGKVGSLSVDPNYLDFEALECNFIQFVFRHVKPSFNIIFS